MRPMGFIEPVEIEKAEAQESANENIGCPDCPWRPKQFEFFLAELQDILCFRCGGVTEATSNREYPYLQWLWCRDPMCGIESPVFDVREGAEKLLEWWWNTLVVIEKKKGVNNWAPKRNVTRKTRPVFVKY